LIADVLQNIEIKNNLGNDEAVGQKKKHTRGQNHLAGELQVKGGFGQVKENFKKRRRKLLFLGS
jgi:hypothetical protein